VSARAHYAGLDAADTAPGYQGKSEAGGVQGDSDLAGTSANFAWGRVRHGLILGR